MEPLPAIRQKLKAHHSRSCYAFYGLLVCLAAWLSGCVTLNDFETSQEYRAQIVGTAGPGQEVGQTFVSRRERLNGIQLWLRPSAKTGSSQNGTLVAELYHARGDTQPLVRLPVSFTEVGKNFPLTLHIPPQTDPAQQSYYLALKTDSGEVAVLGRSEDVYPQGQAFINDAPQAADLAFRLTYDYGPAAMLADLGQWLGQAWLLLPLALALWLPGWLLLHAAGVLSRLDWGSRMAMAVGLSLAIFPVVMTWTTALHLPWSQAAVWAACLMMVGLALWLERDKIARRMPGRRLQPGIVANPTLSLTDIGERKTPRFDWLDLALLVLLVFVFGVRLVMVRDLSAPAWVDSVHHAVITRLILDQGVFPQSYAPYVTSTTASYHEGFHSLVAVFTWLSGLDLTAGLLLLGQALNALASLAVYLFTVTIVKDRRAGFFAALICGVMTPMPAYYTSWGRYTQLAGTLILPAALALLIFVMDDSRSLQGQPWLHNLSGRLRLLAVTGIACAGLFLTHYRVAAFLACLILAYLMVDAVRAIFIHDFKNMLGNAVRSLGFVTVITVFFTLPWWPATLTTLFLPTFARSQVRVAAFSDFSWPFLTTAMGKVALVLAGIGLLLAILQRRIFPWVMLLWIGLLFLIANPGAFGLPGAGFINNTSVEILLFMPLAALGGYLLAWVVMVIMRWLPEYGRKPFLVAAGLGTLVLALVGARLILPILNPTTILFREADRPAIDWIQKNVPEDETILINPFLWGYGMYAGNDGGYWISPLARRKTMPPPVLYGLGDASQIASRVTEISRQVTDQALHPEALASYLQSIGIHYIYVGRRGGPLSPQALSTSPAFETLYAQNGTWVFRVRK